jgi:hypothetical protein
LKVSARAPGAMQPSAADTRNAHRRPTEGAQRQL